MTSALTSQEQQTARVYFQREGRGEKLLKVVSSKALSDVRPNYTLFLNTTQFYSRTLAWLPWLVHGHSSLIFPCPPPPPPPPPHCPTSSCPCPWIGKDIHRKKRKLKKETRACFSLFRSTRCFPLLIPCEQKLPSFLYVFSPVSPISEALCLSIRHETLITSG